MVEIPLKKKYRPTPKVWGYSRTHSGNSSKKKKKLGAGYSDPYVKTDHVLVVDGETGHYRFYHNEAARRILKG